MAKSTTIREMIVTDGNKSYKAEIIVEQVARRKYAYPGARTAYETGQTFQFSLKFKGETVPFVETNKINARIFKQVLPDATSIIKAVGYKPTRWKRVIASNPRRRKAKMNPRYRRCGKQLGHDANITIKIPHSAKAKEFLSSFLSSWAEKLNRHIYFHLFEHEIGYAISFTFSPRFESGSSLSNARRFATEATEQLRQVFGNVIEAYVEEWRE